MKPRILGGRAGMRAAGGAGRPPVVLALDLGTTFIKAALVGADGRLRALARRPCPVRDRSEGRVEIDAQALLRSVDRAVEALHPKRENILALALSSQRSTALVWNPGNGRPVHPALSWQDSRTAARVSKMSSSAPMVERLTGLRLSPFYAGPKIRWILERRKGWLNAARQGRLKAGTLSSFVLFHWLQGRHLQDHGNGQRSLLMNLHSLDWDPALLRLFGIPRACLGTMVPATGLLGRVRRWGLDLPLRAVLGDQQAAALSLPSKSQPLVNYGTGAFVLIPTGTRPLRRKGLLTTLLTSSENSKPLYALEGSVQAAASLFPWAQGTLASRLGKLRLEDRAFPGKLSRAIHGARGKLFCLPSPNGLASPRWVPDLPGAFPGLRARTPAAEILRSMLEAVAFSVHEIFRAAGGRQAPILAGGGLSACDPLLQTQADLEGVPLTRVADPEASLVGAARMAFDSAGRAAPGIRTTPVRGRTFRPRKRSSSRRDFLGWKKVLERQLILHGKRRRAGRRVWQALRSKPLLIGHRGYRARYPENTLNSILAAFKAGADMAECDVQLSRDGVPVLMHDDRVDRTTNGRGILSKLAWKKLRSLDAGAWFGPGFAGERIPTLDRVLRALPPGRLLYIEIKSSLEGLSPKGRPLSARDRNIETKLFELCDRVSDLVRTRGLEDRCLVASFDPRVFRYVKLSSPELRTGYIYSSPQGPALAESFGLQYLDVLCPRHNRVDRKLMDWARIRGLPVFAWTVKTPAVRRRLLALGLTGLVQDEILMR